MPQGRFAVSLIGQKFGRLLVIARLPNNPPGHAVWLCLCDCGTQIARAGGGLRGGNIRSCGCLHIEAAAKRATHGGARRTANGEKHSREYNIWLGIKQRCFNPNRRCYPKYGGRGITMCDRWRADFAAFLADMGPCPPGFSIERKNNDGHYEPGNCAWISLAAQKMNRRVTVRVRRSDGSEITLLELAKERGIPYGTLARALRDGKNPETHVPRKRRRGRS